uniref:Zinc finger, PHD-type, DC1 n=1 Tax=Tanacetum cinerariifolium TaxID=118510 RepID=A0A6L2MNG2_TANCI|nr:zinc finger, PHD-type, DC1 [Tanacetum cinerariifolium]
MSKHFHGESGSSTFETNLTHPFHRHPLTLVDTPSCVESDGECAKCGKDLEDKLILKCLQCKFAIDRDCVPLSKAREDDERHQESRQDWPDQIMLQQVGAIRGTANKLCFVFSYWRVDPEAPASADGRRTSVAG